MRLPRRAPGLILVIAALLPSAVRAAEARKGYDPLAVAGRHDSQPQDMVVKDEARGREIPIRVYLPAQSTPQPVVLFSHGLGGSREGSSFLGRHWAARGYVAVFLQHPGSDTSVWQDKSNADRMSASALCRQPAPRSLTA